MLLKPDTLPPRLDSTVVLSYVAVTWQLFCHVYELSLTCQQLKNSGPLKTSAAGAQIRAPPAARCSPVDLHWQVRPALPVGASCTLAGHALLLLLWLEGDILVEYLLFLEETVSPPPTSVLVAWLEVEGEVRDKFLRFQGVGVGGCC